MSTPTDNKRTFMEAIRAALRDAMATDPNVVLIGEDIGVYGGAFGLTKGLIDEFGADRVRDFPISEGTMAGMAVGAAMTGLKPVIEVMFMDFVALTVDAMCNHAAKIHYMFNGQYSVPMVLRAPMGAGRGYGPSHSQSLAAWFAHVPGIKVVAPSTVADAYGLLRAAIDDPDPVLFLEHKLLYGITECSNDAKTAARIGAARIARQGTDLTVVSFGLGVHTALKVAADFAENSVADIEVVDIRSIRPLDTGTIAASVNRTGGAIVLTEEYPFCGIGSELCAFIQEDCWGALKKPVVRVSGADTTIPCAMTMEQAWLPSAEKLAQAVQALIS